MGQPCALEITKFGKYYFYVNGQCIFPKHRLTNWWLGAPE